MLRNVTGKEKSSGAQRASLFRMGPSQALHIPKAFELPGDEVTIRREGDRLIVEPISEKRGLLATLDALEPLDDEFLDLDEALPRIPRP